MDKAEYDSKIGAYLKSYYLAMEGDFSLTESSSMRFWQ